MVGRGWGSREVFSVGEVKNCLEVMQQIIVSEERGDGWRGGILARQKQMGHRESEPLTDTKEANLASGQQ